MDAASLSWILFYIAATLVGIFFTLIYIAFRKPRRSK